jgi:ArsR family transcriptional regulator, arsenate/arsenite/antimonite-responsive transcriptional repressor / arsenate reductase (thioredoxin)
MMSTSDGAVPCWRPTTVRLVMVNQSSLMYGPAMASKPQALPPPPPQPVFVRLAAHPLRWLLLTTLADSDLRVRDLVTQLDAPQNLLSYHLRQLREGGLVTVRRSSYDGRDSYYHLDLDRCAEALAGTAAALHPTLGRAPGVGAGSGEREGKRPGAVLFLCTGNSVRSPIAEALVRHYFAENVTAASAGTRPRSRLHPNTVRVLSDQFGIDVVGQRPRHVSTVAARRFDHVVTLCDRAREDVPGLAQHARRTHWSIAEPARAGDSEEASYPAFQQVASEIHTRVRHLLPSLS